MSFVKVCSLALMLATTPVASSIAYAGTTDPLFVNETSDNSHRAMMALTFSKSQLDLKHPVTVFLNDRGVLLASKKNAKKFKEQQALLVDLMKSGASVIACPMCMKHFGVNEADLLPGIEVGNPKRTGAALFQDNAKSLSW